MRILPLISGLGAALLFSQAQAAPAAFDRALGQAAHPPVIRVQLQCDPSRCIDPRTGAYTQSGCDYRGCYPISGVVGYTNPETGGYGRYRWHRHWD